MSRRKYPVTTIIRALRANHGLLTLAASDLGCSRQTVYNCAERYPEVAEVLVEERERIIDLAERGLISHLEDKAPWAISLTLRTLGRSRGFTEQPPAGSSPTEDTTEEWINIQTIILRALAPYPEARAAIAEALDNGHAYEPTNGFAQGS